MDGGVLDKMAPDDALEGDGGARVVEFIRRVAGGGGLGRGVRHYLYYGTWNGDL